MRTGTRVRLGAGAALLLAAVACGAVEEEGEGGLGAPPSSLEDQARTEEASGAAVVVEEAAVSAIPAVGPRVIKTGDLAVEVERGSFRDTLRQATAVAGRYGGFVVSTTVEGREARQGTLTIRIPADRFERALGDIQGLGKLERQTVAGQDVGQEFVDLQARLRNFEAQEEVLLRLYEGAQTVADTIKVQREVAGVQLQIEELRGRLRYLEDQAAFGTITVSLAEAGAVPARPGPIRRAWERAVDVFVGLVSGLIVGLGAVIPVGLLLAVAYAAFRRLRPRLTS